MFKSFIAAVLAAISLAAFAAVDVNKATQAELESVKGIGPGISGKILEERKKGTFKDWQDMIDRVKGVGDANAAKFSAEGLTVGGVSFKGAAPAAAKKDDKPAAAAPATPATPAAAAKPATMAAPAAAATTAAAPTAKPAAAEAKKPEAKPDPAAETKAKADADKKAKEDKKATKDAKPAATAAAASAPKK